MPEFSHAQWAAKFNNTTVGAEFAGFGTSVTPIEVLEDAVAAYNKAEIAFNETQTAPPYLNSVSNPATGVIVFDANGAPLQPVSYQVSVLRSFGSAKSTPRTSPTII
ncbi:hypothetical protein QUA71_06980 [Microcoleus sp. MON1_C5]|uniref:hypothetical protein n=1 Tax=Microcoleus sp. MON1_C5 TaxID=2818828 RepID=UPI002FCF863E